MRCVFNEPLDRQTLVANPLSPSGPPGGVAFSAVTGWRAVVKVLRSPVDDLATTIFPAECRSCYGPIERLASVPVCEACVGRVTRSKSLGCYCCGDSFDLDLEDERFAANFAESLLCRECRLATPDFTRAVSFGTYDTELRELIHLLKFERVRGVSRLLSGHLAEAILQLESQTASELLVVAVPLHRRRERERGYNQSVLLADDALRRLKRLRPAWKLIAAHALLVRKRHTESSFVLSRRGRRRNLAGAFRVTGDVAGREVLLIDDIFTSGATARECARVLVRAGAAKVWVATLARAQKGMPRRQHEDPGDAVAAWDLPVEVQA